MAISFQLNLSPAQIEFLQHLDLYSRGTHKSIGDVPDAMIRHNFVSCVQRMIREGLVVHDWVSHKTFKTAEDEKAHRYYRITDKGRSVLALIESDIHAFIERQEEIQRLRKKTA